MWHVQMGNRKISLRPGGGGGGIDIRDRPAPTMSEKLAAVTACPPPPVYSQKDQRITLILLTIHKWGVPPPPPWTVFVGPTWIIPLSPLVRKAGGGWENGHP